MGNRSSRVKSTTWNFNKLAETTGLTRSEVEKFYSDYIAAAGRDGIMDMNEFIQFCSTHPMTRSKNQGAMKDQAIRIFRAFDIDHNGILTFDEFLTVVIMMNSQVSQGDRMNLLIEENNDRPYVNNDKYVSKQYGLEIFRRLNGFNGLPSGTEHQSWDELDQHHRGYVTQEELVEYISRKSMYNR